jgi:hypothetical protein
MTKHPRTLIALGLFLVSTCALAQDFRLEYLDLDTLTSTPATILISPDYQTIIEFEDMQIGQPSSGRTDMLTLEREPNAVRVRANQPMVDTDLIVPVGSETAMFTLTVDEDARAPRRYVVRQTEEDEVRFDLNNWSTTTGRVGMGRNQPEMLPPGVIFDAQVLYLTDEQMVIQYALANVGAAPITAETQKLNLYYEGNKLPRTISRIAPDDGMARIQPEEAEYGTIVISDPPHGSIVLEWPLVQIGPGTTYFIRREYTEGLTRAVE